MIRIEWLKRSIQSLGESALPSADRDGQTVDGGANAASMPQSSSNRPSLVPDSSKRSGSAWPAHNTVAATAPGPATRPPPSDANRPLKTCPQHLLHRVDLQIAFPNSLSAASCLPRLAPSGTGHDVLHRLGLVDQEHKTQWISSTDSCRVGCG